MTTLTLKSSHAPPPPALRMDPPTGDRDVDDRRFRDAVEKYTREMTVYVDRYVRQQSQDMNTISGTVLDEDASAEAAAAQATADANLVLLQNIASDAKITPVEKLLAKKIWDEIVAEGNVSTGTLTTLATTYGVDDSDFDTAYAALNTYLNTTLVVFGDMTATTDITRSTWDTTWNNYYSERTQLVSAIDEAAKTLADAAQAAADAAQADADTAQAAADAAQGTADANLATLNEIASDSKITPVEKLAAKQLWNTIVTEGTPTTGTIPVQATAFGVPDTDFDTAYAALNTYLNTTLNVFGSMTTTTTITRSTWDSTWETYFDEKTQLLNAIAAKAKTLADAAQSDADTAQAAADAAQTAADAAQADADTAQAAADAAQGDATSALSDLADIASDSKITPVEKLEAKARWDLVVEEGTATTGLIPVQATAFGVADTDFDTAYAALDTYLNTTLSVFSNMSATTTVTRATWDSTWKAYYDERTNLLNDIAAKAKTLADAAQSDADTAIADAATAQASADAAQTAADDAQTDATSALNDLADIAADNKVTPVEKLEAKARWDLIVEEGTATTGLIPVQATAFGVADTDFDTAYAALDTYLNTTLTVFSNMSATTTVTRATWNSKWKDYYDERTNLLNDIAAKAKTLADAAQSDADTAIADAATAQAAADAAQSDATAAQGDATTALNSLSDIAADNKITPVEKLEAKQRWLAIVEEGTATTGLIPVQATAFGVADTDFDTAYSNLDTYLNTTLSVFSNMSATTTVTRATWDSTWKAYYDERTSLLNDIAAKAKTLADAAQTDADTAQSAADAAQADATQAIADAATAQSAADAAQGTADANTATLADIADDGEITPVEKLIAKQLWDAIVTEGTPTTGTIPVQATAFSVDDSTFDTAYSNLDTYLNTTLTVFSDMTTSTTVTRATWDTKWKEYYSAKVALLLDIADAAKTLSDQANQTLNNVTITAPIIRTAVSGRRIQMDVDGIKFYTTQTAVGVYGTTANGGSNVVYGTTGAGGDNVTYGTGLLARFYNMTNGIPFDVQLEQTVADMHLYNRSSTPSGAATIGDVAVVSGKFYICTAAGTPGTWTVAGTQI